MIPATVRQTVLERDHYRCVRCGCNVYGKRYSLQHRRARGMGGSKRPDTNSPANLVTVCGHATSPGECHYFIESNPLVALAEGFRVPQHIDPAVIPVRHHRLGLVLLTTDGGVEQVAA